MRHVRNEVGFQAGQRYFLTDAAVGQHEATDQQHRKHPEDEKVLQSPTATHRLSGRALELDAQCQSTESITQVSRDLGPPLAPSSRRGERLVLWPALAVFGKDHHFKRALLPLIQLLGD